MKKDICEDNECCNNHGHKILAILAIVLLVGILLVGAFTAGNLQSQRVVVTSDSASDIKTLSVSGSVTKMVTPDKVDIVLSVRTLDKSAQVSQSENATIADAVKTALKKIGVLDSQIKTVNYSVQEEFQWNDLTRVSESTGYRTVNSIQVSLTDTTAAGKVVDAAIGAGANDVSSISFGLSKEKELEIRTTALNEAASVAKTKANSIASGLGIAVGKVYSISESSFYYTPNYANYDLAKSVAASTGASTPISAGDVEVDASVSVQFEIN